MPTAETTLSYKLDPRGLRDARQELEKTFAPTSLRKMHAALKEQESGVKRLTGEFQKLSKAISAAGEYSKEYKQLSQSLAGVEVSLKRAKSAAGELRGEIAKKFEAEQKSFHIERQQAASKAREQRKAAIEAKGMQDRAAGEARRLSNRERERRADLFQGRDDPERAAMESAKARAAEATATATAEANAKRDAERATQAALRVEQRKAFRQGFMQSVSPWGGAYLEREHGEQQLAGQFVGAGVRKIGSAFGGMLQGQGPLSSILGGVPVAGGIAQLAESSVGSAIDLDRARLANLPFTNVPTDAETRVREKAAQRGLAEDLFRKSGPNQGRISAGVSGRMAADEDRGIHHEHRLLADDSETRATEARYLRQETLKDEKLRWQEARERAFQEAAPVFARQRAANTVRPFESIEAVGKKWLLPPAEAEQAFGQFARTTGGQPGTGEFEQGLAAQGQGVDLGTSAALFRAQQPGRGGGTQLREDMLPSVMKDAIRDGLKGSALNEHLGRLVELQEQAASKGLKIDTEALQGMSSMLHRGMGIAGPRADTITGGFTHAVQNVLENGINGPADMAVFRAFDYKPEQGEKGFFAARHKMASGEGREDALFNILSERVHENENGKDDEDMADNRAGLAIERVFKQLGSTIGEPEAKKMAHLVRGGKEAFAAATPGMKLENGMLSMTPAAQEAAPGGEGTAAGLTAGFDSIGRKQLGQLIAEQNKNSVDLISAGRASAANVLALQGSAAKLAESLPKAAVGLDKLVGLVGDVSWSLQGILGAIGNGSFGGAPGNNGQTLGHP